MASPYQQVVYNTGDGDTIGFIVDAEQDKEGKELVAYAEINEKAGTCHWKVVRAPRRFVAHYGPEGGGNTWYPG